MRLCTSFILKYFRNKSSYNKLSNQMSILLFLSSLTIPVKLPAFKPFFIISEVIFLHFELNNSSYFEQMHRSKLQFEENIQQSLGS